MSTAKFGGAASVALSIANILIENKEVEKIIISQSLSSKLPYSEKLLIVSDLALFRVIWEFFYLPFLVSRSNERILFSLWHYAPTFVPIKQVLTSADSNLYYPHTNFLKNFTGASLLIAWLRKVFRVYGIKRAYQVRFESRAVQERAKNLYNLKRTKYLAPIRIEEKAYCVNPEKGFDMMRFGYIGGWQKNKGFHLLPELAYSLRVNGLVNFKFLLTLDTGSDNFPGYNQQILNYKVTDHFEFVGSVDPRDLHSFYDEVDFVFLLSELESWSNTITETWHYRKVLIYNTNMNLSSELQGTGIPINLSELDDFVDKLINYNMEKRKVHLLNSSANYSKLNTISTFVENFLKI